MQEDPILTPDSNFVPTGSEAPVATGNSQSDSPVSWQTAMHRAIRSAKRLRERLHLPVNSSDLDEIDFPTFVPLEFLSRIQPGDLNDPLLRQVLPVANELDRVVGFGSDPVGDLYALASTGTLHKYQGRALVIATGACGVHCRYCFRREFPYSDTSGQRENWQSSIDYIESKDQIDEVLLSGGDPLTLVDGKLFDLVEKLESIPHVKRLRIHSRMPIVIPQRITQSLVQRLRESRLATWFVIHMNHPNEWDDAVAKSIAMLVDAGIPVLNQAVLLKGVNDSVEVLAELCRTLVNHRVQPYYLHQLDRVQGAAHFEVSTEIGLQLISQLREILPGYALPTYVRENSGEPSKTPLT